MSSQPAGHIWTEPSTQTGEVGAAWMANQGGVDSDAAEGFMLQVWARGFASVSSHGLRK